MTEKPKIIYIIQKTFEPDTFEKARNKADIVCIGDSITGWNNLSMHPTAWPFKTYPHYLQKLLKNLAIANVGDAGETSKKGIYLTQRSLDWFPNAQKYIIGFGANDLAYTKKVTASRTILTNLEKIVDLLSENNKKVILLNVPYLNEPMFPEKDAIETHEKRDYHNQKLAECFENDAIIADICSKLNPEHLGDTLHPNEAGAKIIAKEIYSCLTSEISSK